MSAPVPDSELPDLSVVWSAVIAAVERLGLVPVQSLIEIKASPFLVAVNGSDRTTRHNGALIPPYNVVVWFNDWPFATFNANDGIIGNGAAANAKTLVAALNAVRPANVETAMVQ